MLWVEIWLAGFPRSRLILFMRHSRGKGAWNSCSVEAVGGFLEPWPGGTDIKKGKKAEGAKTDQTHQIHSTCEIKANGGKVKK